MAYPNPSDWNSAAPLSGWYLLNGASPQTCGATGWDLLASLQTELSARVSDAGSLPSFDVTVNSVPINDSSNPSGAVGWSSDVLRVLYAVAQSLGASSQYLSAIQSDAQSGAGPISPATLQTGIWIADRLNHRFTSSGAEIWNAGSPADVSIPAGTSYPLMDAAPPVAPSGTYGSRCNAVSVSEANLIPVVRTVSPFTFSEFLILGILVVAVGAVVVMSRDIPVTGRGGVRKNPSKFSPGQHVLLPRGLQVGMGSLKTQTSAIVDSVHFREEDGSEFYRVSWVDRKGKRRSTYVNASDVGLR